MQVCTHTHKLTEGAFSGFQNFIKFTFDRKVAAVESSLVGVAVMLIWDKSEKAAQHFRYPDLKYS